MTNALMATRIFWADATIRFIIVSDDSGLWINYLTYRRLQGFPVYIGTHTTANLALTLDGSKNGGLARSPSALADSPETRLSAYIRFVNLNRSCQFGSLGKIWSHSKTNPIHKE